MLYMKKDKEKEYFHWKDKILGWSVKIVIIAALLSALIWVTIKTVKYVTSEQFWR